MNKLAQPAVHEVGSAGSVTFAASPSVAPGRPSPSPLRRIQSSDNVDASAPSPRRVYAVNQQRAAVQGGLRDEVLPHHGSGFNLTEGQFLSKISSNMLPW